MAVKKTACFTCLSLTQKMTSLVANPGVAHSAEVYLLTVMEARIPGHVINGFDCWTLAPQFVDGYPLTLSSCGSSYEPTCGGLHEKCLPQTHGCYLGGVMKLSGSTILLEEAHYWRWTWRGHSLVPLLIHSLCILCEAGEVGDVMSQLPPVAICCHACPATMDSPGTKIKPLFLSFIYLFALVNCFWLWCFIIGIEK